MKRLFYFLPVAIFMVIGGFLYWGLNPDRDPNAMPSVLIDQEVPDFALPALEGSDTPALSKADLPDGEVKLINFFASWCVPCLVEHPHLTTLATNETSPVPVMGVAWRDEPRKALGWLKEHGNPYSRIGVDEKNSAGMDFGITGVPETFIVDAKGKVRYKHAGPLQPRDINDTIIPLIVALRKEAAQ